jgi:hypothetical protein
MTVPDQNKRHIWAEIGYTADVRKTNRSKVVFKV